MPQDSDPIHVYVALQRDANGYPPFDTEELDAVQLEDLSTARILATPAFLHGLARGDLVRIKPDAEGRLWVKSVLKDAGHWCARVITFGETDPNDVLKQFTDLGCTADGPRHGLLCIDVPPALDPDAVLAALHRGRDSGAWDFDLGVAPASGSPAADQS
jgi:hypothetical protein